MTIPAKFSEDWLNTFRGEDFLNSSPVFSILSLAAILFGGRGYRTQF